MVNIYASWIRPLRIGPGMASGYEVGVSKLVITPCFFVNPARLAVGAWRETMRRDWQRAACRVVLLHRQTPVGAASMVE